MKATGSWRGAYITLLNANYVRQTLFNYIYQTSNESIESLRG